jgi:hypothetical protein
MAAWRIRRADGQSELRYFEGVSLEKYQPCGSIPSCAEDDLLAWVGEQAGPYDVIQTADGQFFHQNSAYA